MSMLKLAFAAALAVASSTATAGVVQAPSRTTASKVSTCYYEYTVITPDGVYDVYYCYSNGDGSY